MKTIDKFRAWDKKKKKFWHDFRIHPQGFIAPATSHKDGKWIYDWNYNQKNIVLIYNTGLEDKNGTSIFKGDILDIFGAVFFLNGCWVLGEGNFDDYALCNHNKGSAVIGNIYQNPELIKK